MDIKSILAQAADAGESREYIPEGTHTLQCTEYKFSDGTGHKGSVGPAFKFTVLESTDPTVVGKTVSRLVRLNPAIADKGKLKASLKFRNAEVVGLLNALSGETSTLQEVVEVLPKVAALSKAIVGGKCVCVCTPTTGRDGKTYTDYKFGPVA